MKMTLGELFLKELEIQGVGFRASMEGNTLVLYIGFSHPVKFPVPEGIKVSVEKNFIKISKIGFISSEMECSAVFLVSKLRGLKAGAILVVKTPEPPELVKKNPEAIYKLTDDKKAEKGVDNAIRIVLESLLKLSH